MRGRNRPQTALGSVQSSAGRPLGATRTQRLPSPSRCSHGKRHPSRIFADGSCGPPQPASTLTCGVPAAGSPCRTGVRQARHLQGPMRPCWARGSRQLSLWPVRAVRASNWASSKVTSAAVALAVTSSAVSRRRSPRRPPGGKQPRQRHLIRLQAPLLAQPLDSPADLQLGAGEAGATESLVTRELTVFDLHAGQQPAVQWPERHDGQPELLTGGGELIFGGAVDEVVLDLRADRCGSQAAVIGDPQRVGDLPGRVVRRAT